MIDEVKPLKLSRSKLDAFLHCQRCFWLEVHGKAPPIDMAMGVYNVLDSIQKRYYDRYRNDGLPPLLKDKIPLKLADANLVEKLRSGVSFDDEKLKAVLWGKMDDCFVDGKGRLVVMDNKTSSSGPNEEYEEGYRFQLDVYGYLLMKNGFKVAPYGYLVYYIPDKESDFNNGIKFKVETRKFKLDANRILDIFRRAVETAREKKPPARHEECEMCIWMHEMDGIER